MSSLKWSPISVEYTEVIFNSIKGNVAEYFYDFKTIEETKDWVDKAVISHNLGKKKEYVVFEGCEFIGMISPEYISEDSVEVGMWVALNSQGNGFGSRILKELMERLKDEGITNVFYEADSNNIPSLKLASALGFSEVSSGKFVRFVKILK